MTETPDQLAALDRAATQGVWEAHLLDGAAYMVSRPNSASTIQAETVDDLRLAATLVNAYRANQIAVIGPDAVEKMAHALSEAGCAASWDNALEGSRAALAALGVK